MEPLSALGLAAAVVQFLDFGSRMFRDLREIYGSAERTTVKHIELSALADELSELAGSVERNTAASNEPRDSGKGLPSTDDDHEKSQEIFFRLCHECQEINQEIQELLGELQAQGTTRIRLAADSLLVALKGIWSASKLKGLQDRLRETRQQIMMAVLVVLWYVAGTRRLSHFRRKPRLTIR